MNDAVLLTDLHELRLGSGEPVAQARLAPHARCRRLGRSPGLLRLSAEVDRAPS